MGWFSGSTDVDDTKRDDTKRDDKAAVMTADETPEASGKKSKTSSRGKGAPALPAEPVAQGEDAAAPNGDAALTEAAYTESIVFEPRAMEIATAAARPVVGAYTVDNAALAGDRIARFHQVLVRTMARMDLLNAFLDPTFEALLRQAQLAAASADRPEDHDLLALLLADYVRHPDRMTRASIDRAVQVVDLIDTDALTALTVASAIHQLGPTSGGVNEGLAEYDARLASLAPGELPTGIAWLDHLQTVGAIRASQLMPRDTFAELVARHAPGYVCAGIEIGSAAEQAAAKRLTDVGLAMINGIEHQLRPGYSRFNHRDLVSFRSALEAQGVLDEEQIEVLVTVAGDDMGLDDPQPDLIPALAVSIEGHPTLARVQSWWDSITERVDITGVGLVLARANAHRLAPDQPDLD